MLTERVRRRCARLAIVTASWGVRFQKSAWTLDLQGSTAGHDRTVSLRLLYLIFSLVLGQLTLLSRASLSKELAKDIELLVLRHEVTAVQRCR